MKTKYQQAKDALKRQKAWVSRFYKGDKPAQRQILNDLADSLCREFDLPEYQRNLLANFTCKLHPK